jgi:hypothetical protein
MWEAFYGTLGAIAVLMVIIGGFQMIFAFGNVERLKKGKRTVRNAIIGFTIILCSWMIVATIMKVIGAKNQDNWSQVEIN